MSPMQHEIATPAFKVAATGEEAEKAASEMMKAGNSELVIKAQVLSGGRGLGSFMSGLKGGVHMCSR
jgi:succinyl-CoA synthetase beta subunit